MAKTIHVYAHWQGLESPLHIGLLHVLGGHGREIFEFEFDPATVSDPTPIGAALDPRLGLFEGRQHPPQGFQNFGVFADASPDRWGRMLMKRRFERAQRAGNVAKGARLDESDYLLGVHDTFRVGALRFRLSDAGDFLDDQHRMATPPFVHLRALEAASLALESDEANTDERGNDWLDMLIAPGGSLGGARPKASVLDPEGQLWIAKFPSIRDDYDVGAWEFVVHTLALACGLRVPDALTRKYASPRHTFLINRFDRTRAGHRLHFASAMTLTGRNDGDDASAGASYLELARVLIDHGAQTDDDLRELWRRVVFNVLVSNTDDHLRNHGFILVPGKGWRLSEAYDMNPVPRSDGLKLNISEADNALDLELARSVARYFRVGDQEARDTIDQFKSVVKDWPRLATALGIPAREQEEMAPAFRLSD